MNNRFEVIRRALNEQPLQVEPTGGKPPKLDKKGMQKEINSKARKLHERIKELHTLLQHPWIGGKIDLGTDPAKINWDAMPKEIAACFRPEFAYQPGDITAFTISTELDATTGNTIKIDLKRLVLWWSQVYVGAIVRKDYISGTSSILCHSKEGQPRAAREAMEQLNAGLWRHDLTQESNDRQLPQLVHGVNDLRLTQRVFDFAMEILEAHVGIKSK